MILIIILKRYVNLVNIKYIGIINITIVYFINYY